MCRLACDCGRVAGSLVAGFELGPEAGVAGEDLIDFEVVHLAVGLPAAAFSGHLEQEGLVILRQRSGCWAAVTQLLQFSQDVGQLCGGNPLVVAAEQAGPHIDAGHFADGAELGLGGCQYHGALCALLSGVFLGLGVAVAGVAVAGGCLWVRFTKVFIGWGRWSAGLGLLSHMLVDPDHDAGCGGEADECQNEGCDC